jgi:putative peptidoglycan lipid II flippase
MLAGIAWLSSLLLLGAMAMLAAFHTILLPRLASGFDAEKLDLTRHLLFLFLPVILCGGLAAVWGAVLNAKDRFGLVAISQALIPVATIVALLVARDWGIMALVTGMVIGFALRLAALGWELSRLGIDIRPRWHGMQPHLREVIGQYLPMVLGAALLSGTALIEQAVAASLDAGSVAALSYGTRVVMLATGLGATALGTAVLPFFSRMVAAQDWPQVRQTLRTFALLILLVTIPITVVLSVFAVPIVTVVFQRGAFTAEDTARVAEVQAWFALQLPFFGVALLYSRLISSLGANQLLLVQAALCLAIDAVLAYVLSRVFGVAGIALGTTLMYAAAMVILIVMAQRTLRRVEARSDAGEPRANG